MRSLPENASFLLVIINVRLLFLCLSYLNTTVLFYTHLEIAIKK